jgi:hypothetical protein
MVLSHKLNSAAAMNARLEKMFLCKLAGQRKKITPANVLSAAASCLRKMHAAPILQFLHVLLQRGAKARVTFLQQFVERHQQSVQWQHKISVYHSLMQQYLHLPVLHSNTYTPEARTQCQPQQGVQERPTTWQHGTGRAYLSCYIVRIICGHTRAQVHVIHCECDMK